MENEGSANEDPTSKQLLLQLKKCQEAKITMKAEIDSFCNQNGGGDVSSSETSRKVGELEVRLAEEKVRCADLQEKLRDGDKPLKRKVAQLDKNLEQLTVLYQKLVGQNSGLKVECQLNEKKISRKEQRIQQLENNL